MRRGGTATGCTDARQTSSRQARQSVCGRMNCLDIGMCCLWLNACGKIEQTVSTGARSVCIGRPVQAHGQALAAAAAAENHDFKAGHLILSLRFFSHHVLSTHILFISRSAMVYLGCCAEQTPR